jgi:plasmid stabilization system protein ParE
VKSHIQILPQALTEALEAQRWYEDQREGLGLEFEQTLEAALVSIERFPEMYPRVVGDVRRCLMGRFPYGIFYETQDTDLILIVAVFHASRDPTGWHGRI